MQQYTDPLPFDALRVPVHSSDTCRRGRFLSRRPFGRGNSSFAREGMAPAASPHEWMTGLGSVVVAASCKRGRHFLLRLEPAPWKREGCGGFPPGFNHTEVGRIHGLARVYAPLSCLITVCRAPVPLRLPDGPHHSASQERHAAAQAGSVDYTAHSGHRCPERICSGHVRPRPIARAD